MLECPASVPTIMVDVSKWSSQRDWENPAIYERNRARMHVPLRSYRSKDAALKYFTEEPRAAPRPRILNLNSDAGGWRFKLFDKPERVPAEFWEPSYDDSKWDQVSWDPLGPQLSFGFE